MSSSTGFAKLRQLVVDLSLTSEEIRYLRLMLPNTHPDPITELPMELVVLVVLQLELPEVACCLGVSKGWRERFLSHAVIAAYAKRRFPALVNGAMNPSGFLSAIRNLGWAKYYTDWPREDLLYDHNQRLRHHELDPILHDEPTNVPSAYREYDRIDHSLEPIESFYASGKVAFHLCSCVVVIDNLASKTRKVFTPPSGVMHGSELRLRALGSRLAIGSIGRLLIAWDHVNNQAYEKSIPSQILRCKTQGDRVAIILHGGDVLVWNPGHNLLRLDVSTSENWGATLLATFFDARDSNILYVASAISDSMDGNPIIRITIQEFSITGHLLSSWSYGSSCLDSGSNSAHTPAPRCIRMLEYEFERSCIFIYRVVSGRYPECLAVFDKVERTFHDGSKLKYFLTTARNGQQIFDPYSRIQLFTVIVVIYNDQET
ncbi:hypothetical protein F5Y03DRAFT_390422 [Xylaria venustula]|nr:hypothetical protein F5Y03DRAFT_390422 [Xylaria venustula]